MPVSSRDFQVKENSWLAKLASKMLRSDKAAIVFGRTVHLHNIATADFLGNASLLKHELCHVRQYKEHGYIKFILLYLVETMKRGYHNNRFEVEARNAETL